MNVTGAARAGRQPEDTDDRDLTATASVSQGLQTSCLLCSYNGLFFHASPKSRPQPEPTPMERYLEEGPAAQHALFIRADTGRLSTTRDCTCRARIEAEYGHQIRSNDSRL